MAEEARYVVGIDLGTTHTVVASATLSGDDAPSIFPIAQWVSRSERQASPLLASTLYAPLAGELAEARWNTGGFIVGEYAARRGVEVEGRVVHSAKSWLSHTAVDRTAAILPWGTSGDTVDFRPISPVDASARVLGHVREIWNESHPEAPLEHQRIVLTVPASFDETARELTVRAAQSAGLEVRLLEEPQAAFYAWLAAEPEDRLRQLIASHGGQLDAVVCDVGGGTTDLSLLRLSMGAAGEPSIERVAVGRHLLLGGDNMDLALAHACEPSLLGGQGDTRLDAHRFGQLTLACRAAKERLLGQDPPAEVPVVIAAQGAKLVGSTLRATLTVEEVRRIVLQGFFPQTERRVAKADKPRSGLVAFGLPYERDVAITRHLARFCERHLETQRGPRAVLLNGGVFLAEAIAGKVLDVVQGWNDGPIVRLSNAVPELAVALGAVAHGRAALGRGRRIRGGLGRGYYVAVRGSEKSRSLVCVVPRGAEPGEVHVADRQPLALVVGAPVRFELFAAERTFGHRAGDVVTYDEEQFEALPPLAATFSGARSEPPARTRAPEAERAATETEVVLEGELSEVGTLNLSCVAVEPGPGGQRDRFRLAFQIRPTGEPVRALPSSPPSGRTSSRLMDEAGRAVERIFGKGKVEVSPREVKDLQRDLERLLGDRSQWSTAVNRALFDVLLPQGRGRRRSADHERVFWQLAGFCLRPGFGDPGDATRVASFAALIPETLAFGAETRSWQAFWIAWRRVAAGLTDMVQEALRDATDPFLAPSSLRKKRPKSVRPEAIDEMLEMAAALERVTPPRRAELGEWIVEKTWTDRDPRLWTAIGRVGARVPTYASAHYVVPPHVAEHWLDHLLREKWETLSSAPAAALSLARMTGDRARDVRESVRRDVERRLERVGARPEWITAVREVVPLAEQERAAAFGEGLPVGLRLIEIA
ncbi:MAG TPA: Hsp70 family protein [Polyangiaceae bacterium]|nr:Hsp70 family protein [Polyangiaceae bacterium]